MKEQMESISIEEAFEQIEERVKALENPDISLEEAFAKYQEGMELLKLCNASIDTVEKKVKAINEEGELYDFS